MIVTAAEAELVSAAAASRPSVSFLSVFIFQTWSFGLVVLADCTESEDCSLDGRETRK
jgi:hypothetical protein